MKLLKPDNETAMKYDFMLLEKYQVNWKRSYRNKQELFNKEIIEQGNMDDFEYYKTINEEAFYQYYLVEDDGTIIGRARISQRGDTVVIDYMRIEEEKRNMGYGREFVKLIEQDIFTNSEVAGIYFDDASANMETSKIAIKNGYKEIADKQFFKPNPNFKGNKSKGVLLDEQEK